MVELSKKGGRREGSGRKPLQATKIPITIYAYNDDVTLFGGKERLRELILSLIELEKSKLVSK